MNTIFKFKSLAFIAFLMMFSISSYSFAQEDLPPDAPMPPHPPKEKMLEVMKEKLNLTEAQMNQIKKIDESFEAQENALEEQMKALREKRKAVFEQKKAEVEKILSQEQKAKLEEMKAKRKEKAEQRREKVKEKVKQRRAS